MRLLAILAATAIALPACGRDTPPEPVPSAPAPREDGSPPEAAGIRYLERTTGGAAVTDRLPLVVAIHGLGDRPEGFLPVFAGLRARARLVVPYGLDPWQGGFSWFPAGSLDDPPELARGTSLAADRIAAMIAGIVRARPTAGRPIGNRALASRIAACMRPARARTPGTLALATPRDGFGLFMMRSFRSATVGRIGRASFGPHGA
jgi:hypothetical protein